MNATRRQAAGLCEPCATQLLFFVDLVGAFVIPLLTLYLMGVFTRVHRRSGAVALVVGVAYGSLRLLAPWIAESWGVAVLPEFMLENYGSYVVSMLLTAGTMVVMSLFLGWETRETLLHEEAGGWLRSSQLQASQIKAADVALRSELWPVLLGAGVGVVMSFVIFW